MLTTWQNIPLYINPVAFTIGDLSIRWYSLGYLLAFLTIYLILKRRFAFTDNTPLVRSKASDKWDIGGLTFAQLESILLFSFLGALMGGKIGYIIFYDLANFIASPLLSFWPFSNGIFIGLYGMSFHGGLIGALLAGFIACKKYKIDFGKVVNFIIPVFPLGYFWGRIGNFMNGELYGRATESKIGMYFKDNPLVLRHPSQLYEAFGEGLLLFFILLYFSKKKIWANNMFPLFLIFYGLIRFVIEFFRQPDEHLGFVINWLTMGQVLCIIMIVIGLLVLFYKKTFLHKNS